MGLAPASSPAAAVSPASGDATAANAAAAPAPAAAAPAATAAAAPADAGAAASVATQLHPPLLRMRALRFSCNYQLTRQIRGNAVSCPLQCFGDWFSVNRRAVEYLEPSLTLASNHGFDMAVAQFD